MSNTVKAVIGALITLVGAAVVWCLAGEDVSVTGTPGRMWIAGAAAMGLVSGLTTGLSEHPGSGQAFVTFLGAGILVPILGGAAALLANPQVVIEKSTYTGKLLTQKITETAVPHSEAVLDPLAVVGSFFVVFAALAILGLVAGVLLREGGLVVKAN